MKNCLACESLIVKGYYCRFCLEFAPNGVTGRDIYLKGQMKKRNQRYYKKNRKKIINNSIKYAKEHKEQVAQYQKNYAKKHWKQLLEYKKSWKNG